MNYLYFFSGVMLFALTTADILKTTFSSNGGGMVTSLVSRGVWEAFFAASGKRGTSMLLSYAGPAVLVSVLLFWVTGLWSGLFLLLLADPGSVVNSSTLAAADPLEKLYFAGFTLSTLGVGDYIATSDAWRIVTSVAAFSGLAFITASITYFVPVLSAVGLQSKLSLYISSMGKTPQQILINSWNGKDFSSFFDNTSDICQMLMQHTMHHHSYPVIHYFHNNQPELAIAPAIALLDETHQLLLYAVSQDDTRVDKLRMTMLRTALDAYLDLVKGDFLKNISPRGNAPTPDLSQVEDEGIPLHKKEDIGSAFEQGLRERRRLLTSLLEKDGWTWQEVYAS